MDSDHVTVVYKWTAKAGKLDELTDIYQGVTDAMKRDEPGVSEDALPLALVDIQFPAVA